MTAALEVETWRIGSTIPRIFTPPMAGRADTSAEYGIKPEATWGPDCLDFLEGVLGWTLLPWQKWLYHHALEKKADGTGFRFQTTVVLIARQNGKEVDVETPVLTRDNGFKTMGQLTSGDFVFHPDGHPVEVLVAHEIDENPVSYRVTTTDGRSVVACADHQWAVQDRRRSKAKGRAHEKSVRTYEWEVLTTQQMIDRGLEKNRTPKVRPDGSIANEWAFRLPEQKRIISKPVDLPIDPWLLGAWLGDGDHVGGTISTGDGDVEEISRLICESGAVIISSKRVVNSSGACHRIQFDLAPRLRGRLSPFTARLRELGLYRNKHIPDVYLTAGTEQRQALLAGLLDTDGTISKAGQVEFCTVKEGIADGALYLARSLGYRATKVEHRAMLDGRDCGPKYRICFTPADNPFRLPRHAARVNPNVRGDRSVISIASIEPVESRPMRCITVDSEDGRWLVGRDLVPTHKTAWLRGLGIWRLFLSETGECTPTSPGAKTAVIAAQSLNYSENTLKEVVDDIRESPLLKRELVNHRVVNGNHRAVLTHDRTWRAVTATRKGGRGLSVDLAVLDELREFTDFNGWNALVHAITARPNSQIVCASNAGDDRSEVLRSIRDGALRKINTGETEDTTIGFFEWSIPQDVDPRDQHYWHMANPSIGLLNSFSIETLQGFLEVEEKHNMAGFITESLCGWVNALEAGIIPAGHWTETTDPESGRAEGSPIYAAVDVNYDRARAYVAIAARRADGNLHTEVVAMAAGTDWLIPWLKERKSKFAGVAVQEVGAPASAMITELEEVGIPVVKWGPAREVQAGCAILFDGIVEHTIFHRPSPVLDRAATSGAARHSGDAWVFDRRNSPVDVAPLIAVTGAVWLEADRFEAKNPQVYGWDEEKIAQWEREAAEHLDKNG